VVAAVFSAGAQATPGDLDLAFSGDGKQTTDFGSGLGDAAAIVHQPDGKVVAVGSTRSGFELVRYNPNGSLDTSFSGDGRQVTDFFSDYGDAGAATGVALQPDGKIVAVGYVIDEVNEFTDFALARYNPNGSLDTSFSGDGRQTTQHGFGSATGVAIQANGKIVAVGANGDFAVARFNANGSLDTSFSGDGRQTTDFGFGADDGATALALQGNGKIVAVGRAGGGATGNDFALARYNPNGSLDTSFSGDGKRRTDFGAGSDDRATGVGLGCDGKIVAVGHRSSGAADDFALARYNTDGSLDPSFSGDGKQTTDFFGADDRATGVGLERDGKIVAVGKRSSAATDFALARYNANGSLDPSFSGDGRQTTDFGGSDGANGVAIQADGKIVAVGDTLTTAGQNFALARYNPNGSLDSSFSGDGRQRTPFPGSDHAAGVAIQADGKIVTVGQTGDRGDFALARYNPNGSLDPSFSGDGKQTTDFGGIYGGLETATGVAIQGDGKIVAVGVDADYDFALARYNPNGSLDPSFSGDGKQTTDFGGNDVATGVAIQADGKIVAVGQRGTGPGGGDFALARYNPNGSLDTSFSGDGKQTTDFGASDGASDMAIQANGKIVAVGQRSSPAGDDFALARYNPNGSLDPSFSGDGKQTTDFGASDGASDMAIQANGKIVAVGRTGDFSDFALARYNPNGSLDPSFSGDGKQRTDFGAPYNDQASGVALQPDGKIVAVGGGGAGDDFALARYNPNGSLDTSFSGDGKQTTDFGGNDGASDMAIQANGKIVAVGGGADDFALARYLGG
jgi:uncharacterized delta-60 repeat protein